MYFLLILTLCFAFASPYTEIYDKRFAASLYQELAKSCNNFVTSPFLIETAFAALYLGSSRKTAGEFRTELHLPETYKEIKGRYKHLFSLFTNKGYKFQIANKISLLDELEIAPKWQKQVYDVFGIDAELLDVTNKSASAEKINSWFRHKTYNKIDKIVTPEDLNVETGFFVLSASHFGACWAQEFLSKRTRKDNFYNRGKEMEKKSVDTMYLLGHFNYGESKQLQAKFLELTFAEQQASMVVILPNKIDGIQKLETKMEQVLKFRDMKTRPVDISLPKFEMESHFDLKKFLKELGIKQAFVDGKALFDGTVETDCDSPYITKVTQKTSMEVNERGVEAAAGQAPPKTRPPSVSPTYEKFKVDHPFIFYIKIKEVVVYVGRVLAF